MPWLIRVIRGGKRKLVEGGRRRGEQGRQNKGTEKKREKGRKTGKKKRKGLYTLSLSLFPTLPHASHPDPLCLSPQSLPPNRQWTSKI